MKISIIQCPVWGTYDPPMALAQLASCLRKSGYKTFVFDVNINLYLNRTENYKNVWAWEQCDFWHHPDYVKKYFLDNREIVNKNLEQIFNTGSNIFCFSLSSSSRLASLEFARLIKEKNKEAIIIFGGPLFFQEFWVENILNEGVVDIVVPSEGEETLVELVQFIEEKKEKSKCKGISFKEDGKIINTDKRPLILNLDTLPFLDFSDLPLRNYDDSIHIPLMASRGCIQRCVFCSSRSFWPGYRAMSGERIYQEVMLQRSRFDNLSHINFLDLLLNGNMKALITFCDLMNAKPPHPKLTWAANAIIRPEMTYEVLKKMKDSGCIHLIYGIESGSQRVLELMKKNYNIHDADRVIRDTHEVGIMVTANFMFGFPGETEEGFNQTLDFIKRNAKYLDRIYPSRTYCALEEFSYLNNHLAEFNIRPNPPNHLYWESEDGNNIYPERLRRCEEFCQLASALGINVGLGLQTSVDLDKWFNLGQYYESNGDYEKSLESWLNYLELEPKNEMVLSKVKYCTSKMTDKNGLSSELSERIRKFVDAGPVAVNSEAKREEVYANKEIRKKVRFTWNMHYDCNYRCPYCFFEGKWEEYGKRNKYLSVEKWLEYWRRVQDRYGRCSIIITGGEPFTYPDFIELIKRLSRIHYPINISTNTSGDLERFVREIDPQRVSLSLSFQPQFDSLDVFLERVKLVRKHKFGGCLNFVAYPPYFKDIKYYEERVKKTIGENLKIIPFWGEYNGIEYPQGYTPEEKQLIGMADGWFAKIHKKGQNCPAGYHCALIFPDGKVARCGQVGENFVIGNFFDPNFRLLDKPLPCDADFCPCEEDVVEDDLGVEEEKRVMVDLKDVQEEKNKARPDKALDSKEIILDYLPKMVFIQASGPCNSNCVFCSRGSNYEFFNLEEYQRRFENKLIRNIFPKIECLVLTGSGEFLFLPEGQRILDYFDNALPQVSKLFFTNGSTLNPQVCEKIVYGKSKYTIHISLHASNSQLHKTLTTTDNFHEILGQLNYLLKLRRSTGNPIINLIFVATTLNIEDFPNFVRMAAQLEVDKVVCYYNYIYTSAQKYLSCFFKPELTNKILSEAEETADRLKIKIDLPPKFGQKHYPDKGICREPWTQIMIDNQGRVLPCDASEDCNETLDGRDFWDVWNGPYYRKLRESLMTKTASCFKYCLRANPQSVNDFKAHIIRRGNNLSQLLENDN